MPSMRRMLMALAMLSCGPAVATSWSAPCMLANPSFEIPGSGGVTFGGWSQFGSVGSSAIATHGALAARVSGPNTHAWDVSGYWQQLDAVPGERWSASVFVSHPSTRPLAGQSQAIVNIEWRNASGGLISYESHVAADASTPPDVMRAFAFQSQPAPPGTAGARLLLGVLQGPSDPVPDVIYDHATFEREGSPTLAERQWLDFPGGRTVTFSGRSWRVKGPGYYEPGPSQFSDNAANIWVDVDGRLHLTIKKVGGIWYSTEVALQDPLGYGDYIFTTRGRLDALDPVAVLGLFLWQYGPCYDPANMWWNPYNEIDVEFSRWGIAGSPVEQFVAQPFDSPGNVNRFSATFSDGEVTSHAFRWLPGRVEYRSWRGGPGDEATSAQIHAWTYAGPHLPRPDQPRVHLNLWQFNAVPATHQEVVMDAFTFVPACTTPPCGVVAVAPPEHSVPRLTTASPNPFQWSTAIRYGLATGGPAQLVVYDLSGRRVRTLVDGFVGAGEHETMWNGCDDSGRRLGAGVYLYRYRADGRVETRPVVLVR